MRRGPTEACEKAAVPRLVAPRLTGSSTGGGGLRSSASRLVVWDATQRFGGQRMSMFSRPRTRTARRTCQMSVPNNPSPASSGRWSIRSESTLHSAQSAARLTRRSPVALRPRLATGVPLSHLSVRAHLRRDKMTNVLTGYRNRPRGPSSGQYSAYGADGTDLVARP